MYHVATVVRGVCCVYQFLHDSVGRKVASVWWWGVVVQVGAAGVRITRHCIAVPITRSGTSRPGRESRTANGGRVVAALLVRWLSSLRFSCTADSRG